MRILRNISHCFKFNSKLFNVFEHYRASVLNYNTLKCIGNKSVAQRTTVELKCVKKPKSHRTTVELKCVKKPKSHRTTVELKCVIYIEINKK